ncbi:CDP-diacylglycerol--serine O-phosphatidyltransferase [Clostridium tetani]|uniref:CDP-diacylglycerol--serine O-phosphatidyltransferase n=1 Tax=Clostridium tetani TaxID=1513 RepID=A0ABC8EBS9_CLOTA|nr:CDP-diacylglycerol--serine O-phosphatidyltransferase [Clostridium tetani]BDR67078.1 CDP-diacylglycerol--serine O-phosphatidyltransferase [Clostridium tetani]BDR72490.1 CDP-diacylglycerol--serine O-phosphatidyltransferase [Clostridium tetani]BDR80965.1 CDP-diacylglycerol--serine O-phosphatidyltransferase [Clostridium tetani]BDR89422.1 CDP-diacylglycerol--serine O-phosphatidyltransferase [Clostridium tetani]
MKKIKNIIPNLFTFGNLIFGTMSLIMTFDEKYFTAGVFIIIAALLDRYDGRIARILNVSSELGKELDSLADLISFGVAPSMLIYNMYNFSDKGILGYFLLLIFPVAGAYRLARYNVASFDGVFSGIPITIAGILLVIYSLGSPFIIYNQIMTYLVIILLSYLMVSKVEFKKV